MHDITPGAEVLGKVTYHGEDLYASKVDPAEVRRRIGMVFQKPNPFPKSVYDNVAYGPRINGAKRSEVSDIVEKALTQAALWDEVHGKLRQSALALSGGQQQAVVHRPLPRGLSRRDPHGRALFRARPDRTARIEDLMDELKNLYTIVIVTHKCNRRRRGLRSHWRSSPPRWTMPVTVEGRLIEYDVTETIFTTRLIPAPRGTSPGGSADRRDRRDGRDRHARCGAGVFSPSRSGR